MELRQPLIPIVILNWNGLEVTEECLQALKIQTYQNFEIHLVDNGSLNAEKKQLMDAIEGDVHDLQDHQDKIISSIKGD